jgi:hypothetical protein
MLPAICIVALTAAPDAPLMLEPAPPPEPPSKKWFAVPSVVGGAGVALLAVGGLVWFVEELAYDSIDALFQTSGGPRDYSASNNILLAGVIALGVGAVGMLVVHSIRSNWTPPREPAPAPSPPPTPPPEPALAPAIPGL